LPLLTFIRCAPRQDEAEWLTVGKQPIWPVSSTIVWATIAPRPSTVNNVSEAGGVVQRLTDGLCQDGALLAQTVPQRQAAGDRQALCSLGQ
jgi:hypothetical protein